MKTLYIPISSLNFNSIFASESISPSIFYQKRNFGYKIFEKIEELRSFNNSIILYDKFPVFDIKPDGRDNYPMVVEIKIEFDIQSVKTIDAVSIYQYGKTIYLSPFTTKVYFLSEEAKKMSILASERSLSTKMVPLYERCGCFDVLKDELNILKFQFSSDFIDGIEDVLDKKIGKYIDIDKCKNKAKGFLYSYLLGANKSLSKELIIIKKSTREISNIISAIINSPDKIPTRFQKDDLQKNADFFDAVYKKVDKETSELDFLLKKHGNEISVYSLKKIFENKNLVEKIKNVFDIFEVTANSHSFESAISKINNKVIQVEKEYFANKQKMNLSEKISFANIKLTRFDEDRPDFYVALINEYLSIDYQGESRLDVATIGIKLLIKMYEEKKITWNPSTQRDYFNELLSNMQGKGTFDVRKNKDVIHQSFALFVLHKEKDEIEKLEAALISNTICEFRFAFGLWGAFNGFSNMPKTLSNDLFLSDDLDYVSEVYKYIYKQVHDIELEGELERKQEKKISSSKLNNRQIENINSIISNATLLEQELSEFEEFILKDKIIKNEIITKLNEIGIFSFSDWDNKKVDSIKWISSKGQKKLIKVVSSKLKKQKPKKKSQKITQLLNSSSDIFANQFLEKDFYLDEHVFDRIESLLSTDKKERNKVKTELDWIQKVHKNGGYPKKSGDWVKLDDHSNQAVIKHFENNAKERIEPNLLTKIVERLKELYL